MMDRQRPFGFWTAPAPVVGGMIGAGVLVLAAQMANDGATGAVAWRVAIGGGLALTWVVVGLAAAGLSPMLMLTAVPLYLRRPKRDLRPAVPWIGIEP
jgi:hypothetical protein